MPPRPVRALAHRGGARHPDLIGLENTLAAFRHATALGFTHLETDVQVTRDGVVVAFHDATLDRATDATGRVGDLDWAQVREARVGGREPVPALGDLLDALPGACFNVDLKSDRAADALAALVLGRGVEHRVLVGSFSPARITRFRRATAGRVVTAAHPVEVAAFRLLPSGRLAHRLTRHRVGALQVPHHRGRFRVVTPGLVRRAHAAGVEVHVWTVDDAAEMHHLLDRGVDGLVTDRTDRLADVLRQRGRPLRPPAAPPARDSRDSPDGTDSTDATDATRRRGA